MKQPTQRGTRRVLKVMVMLVAVAIALPLLVIGVAQLGALGGSRPADLGVRDGRLKPPSSTPNSVTSQADLHPDHPMRQRARIEPLRYSGDGRAAMQRLARIVAGMERTRITVQQPDYIRAECTSRLMRYTDDLELWLDESAGVIHVRSASRIGHGDRGVNRARVESIRAALARG